MVMYFYGLSLQELGDLPLYTFHSLFGNITKIHNFFNASEEKPDVTPNEARNLAIMTG